VHQPIAEVERWLARHDWHIGMIEDGADAARVCAGAGKGGQALSPHALQMLLVHLEQYASDAAQLPMPAFAAAARAADYDAAALAHMLSVPLSRVLRRLAALPPDDGHPPVGLVTCDAAGAITLFKQVPGFSLHRGGLACPLWPLFTALGQLGRPLWCDAMLPDAAASRLRCVAIAVQTGEASITMPPLVTSTMIVITDLPKGPDETLLLGPSCRICSRLDCPARREPSALAAGQ
jgi:predicted transcriptional regulator